MKNTSAFFTNKKTVFLLATLCCLLWGSAYPAIKNGYALFQIADDDIPTKLVFAGYRFFFAGLLLLLLAFVSGKAVLRFGSGSIRQVVVLGFFQTAVQYVFFYVGLAYTTGVKGSIMNATSTFFSVLLAHFIYKNDKLSVNKSLGCILGFIGVAVVNLKGLDGFNFTLMGDGFVVIAAFILSAATIYGKRISQTIDPIVMSGYQLAFGGLLLAFVGYVFGGELHFYGAWSIVNLIYLVLLSSIAFALWSQLLKFNKVGTVAPFNFLIPIAGAVLSALFLDESILEWRFAVALILVCLGIGLVNRLPRTR